MISGGGKDLIQQQQNNNSNGNNESSGGNNNNSATNRDLNGVPPSRRPTAPLPALPKVATTSPNVVQPLLPTKNTSNANNTTAKGGNSPLSRSNDPPPTSVTVSTGHQGFTSSPSILLSGQHNNIQHHQRHSTTSATPSNDSSSSSNHNNSNNNGQHSKFEKVFQFWKRSEFLEFLSKPATEASTSSSSSSSSHPKTRFASPTNKGDRIQRQPEEPPTQLYVYLANAITRTDLHRKQGKANRAS